MDRDGVHDRKDILINRGYENGWDNMFLLVNGEESYRSKNTWGMKEARIPWITLYLYGIRRDDMIHCPLRGIAMMRWNIRYHRPPLMRE